MTQQIPSNSVDPTVGVINTKATAELFCSQFHDTLQNLKNTIQSETLHLREMKIADVEFIQDRKSDLSRTYARDIKMFGANAVQIGRLAPTTVEVLRREHTALRAAIVENEQILGTVKSVSESLIRRTAERVANANHPKTYTAAATGNGIGQVAAVACDRKL